MSTLRRGTAILGVRWKDANGTKVLIAADSQTTIGETRFISKDPQAKLVKFPNFVVGVAGAGPIQEVVIKMTKKEKYRRLKLTNPMQVQDFAKDIFTEFSKLLKSALTTIEPEESESLLIATKTDLYQVCTEMSVLNLDKLVAVGSGGDFALGAATALYSQLSPGSVSWSQLTKLAEQSISIACSLSIECAEPVRTVIVT